MRFVRHYLLALQFFTRIPVRGRLAAWVGFSPAMQQASAAHLPGVGWLLGGGMAGCLWAVHQALPAAAATPWVAALAATTLGVMLTGALHEDGLADLSDGLGGGLSRERALEIMKDSRIGSYGAIALVLALAGKLSLLSLLAQLHLGVAALALLVAQVLSRFMPLLIMRGLPYVGQSQSKSAALAQPPGAGGLLAGGLWVLAALALAWGVAPATPWWAAVAGSLLAWYGLQCRLRKRLQGFTGDALGACQQLSELGFYLGLLLAW